jgi:hypothetical protein
MSESESQTRSSRAYSRGISRARDDSDKALDQLVRDAYPEHERIEMPETLVSRIVIAFRRESKWSTASFRFQ